jgi:hypothetical protein
MSGVAPQGESLAATKRPLRAPALWGLVFGGIQAASPLAFWWLDTATVYALGLVLIASVYIGFAVADGRAPVIAFESGVAGLFVVVAAAAVTGSPWLLVVGLAGHGLKDLWQHRRQFVANTRRWPPVLPRGRLGRRRDHRHRNRRGRSLPPLVAGAAPHPLRARSPRGQKHD